MFQTASAGFVLDRFKPALERFKPKKAPPPPPLGLFQIAAPTTYVGGLVQTLELIFNVAVRDVRKGSGNAILGLFMTVMQAITMVLFFWFMLTVLHMRGSAVRGDFLLYSMSGMFMYMTHIKAIRAASAADGPTSAMMKHSSMNTIVAISGTALSALYQQIFAICVILFFYNACFNEITIEHPVAAFCMLIMSWATGIAIGMIFKAATPWAPNFFAVLNSVYTRANMVASGKMFLANAYPTAKLAWFNWNPLFHIIDQNRGFVFLNYHPHYSSITYPIYATGVLFTIGLMIDRFTQKYASASWFAGK